MSELVIAGKLPASPDLHQYMRKTRKGKIKTVARSKSGLAIKLTIFFLFGLTAYGFLTFDYKDINFANAVAGTWRNVQIMFGQPSLRHTNWPAALNALFVTFSLGALSTIFGAKVIDQGSDESVNAVNIKKFVGLCTDVETTTDTRKATLIQTRHRIPEIPLTSGQILVFQVPIPEPLRIVEAHEEVTKKMHAEKDYAPMWLQLFESLVKYKKVTVSSEYPCMVEGRYMMNPSPIPKFDNPKLHKAECLYLFGAGREKKIYAIPPHTEVISLAFDDVPFERENFAGKQCRLCGSAVTYLDEMFDSLTGDKVYQCSDTSFCQEVRHGSA